MKLIQIKVTCLTALRDTVSAVMSLVDDNLLIEDLSDIEELDTCYGELIDETLLNGDREHVSVSFFKEDEGDADRCAEAVKEQLDKDGIEYTMEKSVLDDTDWENEWKKYYDPVHIGKHIVIVPAWQEYTPEDGQTVVTMDPGLAFGTGTHETTRLCAALLEKYLRQGMSVLDVGTGSGILAIISRKLGADRVSGTDLDPVAVRVARENADANGCGDINFFVSDLLDAVDGRHDIVTANIVADILVRMSSDVTRVLGSDGLLIASGIIDTREEEVDAAMRAAGLIPVERLCENDWRALVYRAPKN